MIRLDSASSDRNSRRFTPTEHYQLMSRTLRNGTLKIRGGVEGGGPFQVTSAVLHTCTDRFPGIPDTHPLCAQCRGEEGALPAFHSGPGYPPEGVWLHCARFWSPKAPAAPRAKVESTLASAGTGNGDGDPWADLDIPAYLNRQ
jgi:hypothetical protein